VAIAISIIRIRFCTTKRGGERRQEKAMGNMKEERKDAERQKYGYEQTQKFRSMEGKETPKCRSTEGKETPKCRSTEGKGDTKMQVAEGKGDL
jgi:hypothetical protein